MAPKADPGDGLLDVVLVRSSDRQKLADSLDARARSSHVPMPNLRVRRGRAFEVTPPAGVALHLDDGLWPTKRRAGPVGPIAVQIAPGLVRVVRPA